MSADLQSPASASDGEWGWRTPSIRGLAGGHALTVISAKSNRNLDHGRNNSYALCVSHDFVGNSFVFSRHDLVQDRGRILNAFLNVRLVLVRGPSEAAEKEQPRAEGQKKSSNCPCFSFHRFTSWLSDYKDS